MGNRDEQEDVNRGESGGKRQKKVLHSHLIVVQTYGPRWSSEQNAPSDASTAWYMPSEVLEIIRISEYMYLEYMYVISRVLEYLNLTILSILLSLPHILSLYEQ